MSVLILLLTPITFHLRNKFRDPHKTNCNVEIFTTYNHSSSIIKFYTGLLGLMLNVSTISSCLLLLPIITLKQNSQKPSATTQRRESCS